VFDTGTAVSAYGQLVYFKDTVDPTTTSEYTTQFQAFFSSAETVKPGYVLVADDGRYLHVRTSYPILDGFICCESDDLGYEALKTATWVTTGDYDVATDTKAEVQTAVEVLVLDYFQLYGRETAMAYGQSPGDLTFIVAQQPKAGDEYALDGLRYSVLEVKTNQDAFTLHMRRA
jgi:hypothetical protein